MGSRSFILVHQDSEVSFINYSVYAHTTVMVSIENKTHKSSAGAFKRWILTDFCINLKSIRFCFGIRNFEGKKYHSMLTHLLNLQGRSVVILGHLQMKIMEWLLTASKVYSCCWHTHSKASYTLYKFSAALYYPLEAIVPYST